jgi:copper chaperone CopZ
MKPITRLILRGHVPAALALTLLAAPVFGDGLREVDQTIFGMDCAPCAYGVEQGLSKLPGVTAVRVSLNEGKAVAEFAPDSTTTLAQIREVIRHNGFTPKDARVTLVGRLVREGDRWWIDAGAGARWLLDAPDHTLPDAQAPASANEVTLQVVAPETLSTPPTVRVIKREG